MVTVDSMANPSFLLSLISSRGTFGQENLFSLRPGNQRDPWPGRHSTADQTGRVPLEWHLEPLQGMRAPTDLQSSRQNLSGLKERGKRSSTNSDGMKEVEPSSTSVLWWTDPRTVGSVAFVRMLKFRDFPMTAICAKAEMYLHKSWYTFKDKSQDVFTWFSFLSLSRFKIIRIRIRIHRNWQRNRPSYWLRHRKKGWFLRGKKVDFGSQLRESSTEKCIPYTKQQVLLLSTTRNSTAEAWVCFCASFTFCKNIPSALFNRQGGGKEEKLIQ